MFLPRLLAELELAASRSEAGRLLKQGAVSIDGERVAPGTLEREADAGDEWLVKVGKRRFARISVE